MIKPICRDVLFLGQKSEPAVMADRQVGQDLLDTLQAHAHECVGMAANMIGIKKNIIVVNMGILNMVMFNPVIT
ncbi:MAG: peptide deformylase, partial [Parasporobacterium sp.]|nr:peptide deformylase [Parasporobacterium sp.]